MRTQFFLIFLIASFFFAPYQTLALEILGNGFECDNGEVFFKGKALTATKANKRAASRLRKARKKRATAKKQRVSKQKLAKLSRKVKKLKSLKDGVKNCLSNDPTPTKSSVIDTVRTLTGSYPNGSYSIVSEDLPIQGNINADFSLDGTVFSGSIGFDGLFQFLFGEDPIIFSQDIANLSFPLQFETPPTPALGKIVILLNEDRTLVFSAPEVPGDDVDNITYNGAFTEERGFDGSIRMVDPDGNTLVQGVLSIAP